MKLADRPGWAPNADEVLAALVAAEVARITPPPMADRRIRDRVPRTTRRGKP